MNLLKYIQGKRKGKEAHRLEKEAMHDPFLADALEGYAKVDGDHLKAIEELQRKVSDRNTSRKRIIWTWGIAASLLTGVFIGGYYLLDSDPALHEMVAHDPDIIMEEREGETQMIQEKLTSIETDTFSVSSPSMERIAQRKELVPSPTLPSVPNDEILYIVDDELEEMEYIDSIEGDHVAAESYIVYPEIEIKELEEMSARMAEMSSGRVIASAPAAVSGKAMGTIVDNDGEPIIGASVIIEGTNKGTVTDMDGNFALDISPDDDILSISYIGYESLTLPLDTGKNMLIAMNNSGSALEEVVVVGYGSEKKKDLTGASVSLPVSASTSEPVIGYKKYKEYLKNNVRYSEDKDCKKKKGKVELSFYIDGNGRPYDMRIEKNLCPSNDNEAIRLVEEGPDWTQGSERIHLEVKF